LVPKEEEEEDDHNFKKREKIDDFEINDL